MDYGTVISTFDGPSTRKFSFVINPDAVIRRGQFVQLDIDDGKLIGRVADIRKTNRYFINPESVKNVETSAPVSEVYPTWEWEYLVADVVSLGVFTGDGFQDSLFPPSPGVNVSEPDQNIIQRFFGLEENGLHLGSLFHHKLDVRLNVTRLLQKHLAILALSGAGKSYLVSVLIEELLKRKPEEGQMAVVVMDPHGEYTAFADDAGYSNKTRVFGISDIRISLRGISPYKLESLLDLSPSQTRVLFKIIDKFRGNYSVTDLLQAIEAKEDIKADTRDILLSAIKSLGRTGLFGLENNPKVTDIARPGTLTVVDLSSTISIKKKQIVVDHLARKLFNSRRQELIPPFLLILEEAHQFAPEGVKKGQAISSSIIETIAREGRKFHASLCLVSQRPIRLNTTILSQCNTNIILRITNPYDLKHIGESSEGITTDVLGQISSLPVGSGLIVGEAVNFPLLVKIRERISKESEKGKPLERAAVEFGKKEKKMKDDSKAFM